MKRKAGHPALQFHPTAAGGKKAKLDGTGNPVKNAVATLNEFKPGLAYQLVETKGWHPLKLMLPAYSSLACLMPASLMVVAFCIVSCSGMAHAPCYVFQVVVNNQQFRGEGR